MLWLIVAALLPLAYADGTFFITASKYFRPGSPFDVHVTLLNPGTSAEVTAFVGSRVHAYYAGNPEPGMDVTPKVIVSQTETISGSGKITLMIPESLDDSNRFFELNVTGAGGVTFKNSTKLEQLYKTVSIFVQTDKARYKPGDEVKFRVFATGADLRTHTGNIDVEIYDGDNNKIKQWLNHAIPTGLFTGALPISTQPILGQWKIKVTVNDEEQEKTFKVEEYVLPKFKVEVELPSYVVKHMESVPITVKANYTFGKPVEGDAMVIVRMQPGYNCYDPYDDSDRDQYSYMDRKPCKSEIFKVQLKDGMFSQDVPRKDLEGLLMTACYRRSGSCSEEKQYAYSTFEVIANVTDRATGEVISSRSSITIEDHALRIKVMDATPDSYKPGLDFKAWIKVERPDGQPPAPGEIKDGLNIMIHYNCPYFRPSNTTPTCEERDSQKYVVKMQDYPDGLVQYTLPETVDEKYNSFSLKIWLTDKHDEVIETLSNTIRKFETKTANNIQIQMDTLPALKAGSTATFKIRSSERISTIYYQLLSKGEIVRQDIIEAASPANQHDLVLTLDADFAQSLSPTAKLIVLYFTETEDGKKEAIADSVSFNVDATFAYDTEVSFSKSEVKPAEQLVVNVASARDSTVALLAVDQSVLLLESGNDITVDMVEEEVRSYDPKSYYYPWMRYYSFGRRRKRSFIGGCFPIFIGGRNIKEMMNEAGMIFMCDCVQQGNTFDDHYALVVRYDAAPAMGGAVPLVPKANADDSSSKPVRTRQLFPETWIWESLSLRDGSLEIPVNAPDTITSWVLSAFAINPQLGVSVAPTTKTTVFQPFFARMSLPYSIVRGEQFALKVTVFNYLPSEQDVSLVIDKSDKFKVIDGNGTLKNERVERIRKVASQSTVTEVIWVVPEALGHVPIRVSATSPQAGDIVIQNILVKAEGAPRTYSESQFMEVSSGSPTTLKFLPDIPDDAVPGSARIVVNVVGDLMGSAMDNLDGLIKMPYGCGEQNMINFAPNIYIMKYLGVTGQDNQEVRDKAIKYMDQGYQRELTYKRKDHSYSAFGERDKEGSTWLTAFVLKCFSQAKDYIQVDENILKESTKFLMRAQQTSGEFEKIGSVHHSGLKGGAGEGVGLTAFTTIALLELQEIIPSDELEDSIKKAVGFLENQIDGSRENAYALSIITYALSLAKSSQASYALNQLNALATERKGQKFWSDDQGQSDTLPPWERYYSTPPLDVETGAYALMSTLLQNGEGVPIVRWLASRMNPQGGFYSTQDTVLGLEALGKFAENLYSEVETQSVNVEVMAMNNVHEFERITTANSAIVQVYEVPNNAAEVTLTATGEGAVVVQMTVTYNVMEQKKSEDFDIDVNSDFKDNSVTVSVCMSYKGKEESGMSIMEVTSLSGFYPDGSKGLIEKYKNQGIKTAEVDGDKMVTYWDEIDGEKKCVQVEQRRADSVMKLQQQQVKVYRYYSPEVQQAAFYQVPAQLQSVDICVSCPDCEGCGRLQSSGVGLHGIISTLLVCLISAFLMRI